MTQRFAHHCTIARCVMLLSMAVLLLWIAQPAQAARQGRYAPLIRKAHTWPAKRVVAAGDRHSSARYSAIFDHFIAFFSPLLSSGSVHFHENGIPGFAVFISIA